MITLPSLALAQITVSGNIVDTDKKPIAFANIVLTKPDTNEFIAGSISNDQGEFNLTTAKKTTVQITISVIGFKSWSRQISASEDLSTITLHQETYGLEEVVLLGEKQAITKKGDQLIFKVQNTPLKSGYDGLEILKVTPYVWIDENDAITMRDSQARVLINGRRINMSGSELSNYISNLNSENILSIEVQTNQGANSSAVTTGGIINIILKEQPKGVRGQFKSYYLNRGAGYDLGYLGLSTSYGSEKWNLYGSYNSRSSETFNAINNTVNFLESARTNTTLSALERDLKRQNYQLGVVTTLRKSHELGAEIFGTQSDQESTNLGAIGYFNNEQPIDTGRNDIIGNTNSERLNGVLNYKWSISPQDKFTVVADYLKSKNNGGSIVTNSYQNGTVADSQNSYTSNDQTEVYAVQADYSKVLKNELAIDFGGKYTATNRFNSLLSELINGSDLILNPQETTDFNYQEDVGAVYLQGTKTYKEKNYFKLGLRAENTALNKTDFITGDLVTQDYVNWFPSAYYSRTLDEKKSLSLSYSRSLRRPSFRALSGNITKVNDFQFILGNPDLNPEFIALFELSYDYNQSGLTAYYRDTNDAINGIYFIEDEVAFYKQFNAGSQIQYGLQYNSSKKLKSWWYVRFSSNLYNRKFVNEAGESSFEKATLAARLFSTFSLNKTTSIDLSSRYISPRADAFYESEAVYATNITFKKSFFNKKLNLRVYLNDIFNTLRYRNIRQFAAFSTNADNNPRRREIQFWLTYDVSNNKKLLSKKNKSKNNATNRL